MYQQMEYVHQVQYFQMICSPYQQQPQFQEDSSYSQPQRIQDQFMNLSQHMWMGCELQSSYQRFSKLIYLKMNVGNNININFNNQLKLQNISNNKPDSYHIPSYTYTHKYMTTYQTTIQNSKLSSYPNILQQQSSTIYTHSHICLIFQILLSIYGLNYILKYDRSSKKITFGLALMLILYIADNNSQCARTAVFLLNLISLQIIIMAFSIGCLLMAIRLQIFVNILPNYSHNSHRYNYTFIILILLSTNAIGLIYCLLQQYHYQLYQFPQIFIMLGMVSIGFVIVAVSDYLYLSISRQNIKMSTRRKIFHFVPVGLLPILVHVHYRLFTLMVFGSFYLFWMLEILRYYGKLAKHQIGQQIRREQPKGISGNKQQMMDVRYGNVLDIKQVEGNKQSKQGKQGKQSKQNVIVVMTRYLNICNIRITQLPLIKWMEQLNLDRQPYFWFTHLSLILGLSLTYIYYYIPSSNIHHSRINNHIKHSHSPTLKYQHDLHTLQTYINQNMSIILIISDAFAAIVGKKYGKKQHIIPYTNNKTIQGYLGFAFTTIILQLVFYIGMGMGLFMYNDYSLWDIDYVFIVLSGVCCALGELFSGDLDNVVIGVVFIGLHWVWARGKMAMGI